jgi:hypothetical protein
MSSMLGAPVVDVDVDVDVDVEAAFDTEFRF